MELLEGHAAESEETNMKECYCKNRNDVTVLYRLLAALTLIILGMHSRVTHVGLSHRCACGSKMGGASSTGISVPCIISDLCQQIEPFQQIIVSLM